MQSDSLAKLLAVEMPAKVREPKFSTWRGCPVMTIPVSGGREMTFGLCKAEAVLQFMEDIRVFVDTCRDVDRGKPMPKVMIGGIDNIEEEIRDDPREPAIEEDWETRLEKEVAEVTY